MAAFFTKHAFDDFDLVVEALILGKIIERAGRTGTRVTAGIDQPRDPGQDG